MKKKRQANFELLRIVAMVMIITLHYLVKGGAASPLTEDSALPVYFAWLLESFCLVAVNCYVLISGYFLVESDWKPGRIVSLVCQVLFYSLLIPAALILTGVISADSVSLYEWAEYLFPISTEHYWFATAYLMMYLFAPLLAEGIRRMDKRSLQIATGLLLFFWTVVKSFVPLAFATDRFGYDFGWFLCLFVLAGYLRRFGLPWLEKRSHAVFLYAASSVGAWALMLACAEVSGAVAALSVYGERIYTYNHILCLTGAVALFYVFKDSPVSEGRASELICKAAPYTFGVYLLHEHVLVRYRWLEWAGADAAAGTWGFLPHMLICVAAVYAAGTAVDYIRARLFEMVRKGLRHRA
ncbi:MAG: acyltransferase [Lachnospiraceae bacterium]|nr:acyltransferase [Lachnospiraceae bacterium]